MIAYIDEAGDIGTGGRGTRWFVFGCVMVADANVDKMRAWVDAAQYLVGKDSLHFNELTHDDKLGVIGFLQDAPYAGVIVATDTTKIKRGSQLANPFVQHNYAARYVVERISRYAKELGEQATIYFEHLRGFDYAGFDGYMTYLINNPNEPRLDPEYISPGRISRMQKDDDSLLCVADGLAHAAFRALEPQRRWRHYETSYIDRFLSSLWRGPASDENIRTWGVVLMPTPLRIQFEQEHPWLRDLESK